RHFIMSRNSKRKRNKRSKKRCGRPKIVADAPRSSTKRKRCRSNKKRMRKFKRVKFHCTICSHSSHGKRRFLDCGHVFHRKCVNPWLKNHTSKCPNCRKDIPTNTGRHQRSIPEIRPDSSANPHTLILSIPREVLRARELLQPIQNLDNPSIDLDVPSPNLDNLNMDLDYPSFNLDNSSTDLRDQFPNLHNLRIDFVDRSSDMNNSSTDLDLRSSDMDNSSIDLDLQSSDMDNSSIDSVDSSPNFDNSRADSSYPSPNLDIPARQPPRPSRNLDNPSVELPVLFVPVLCCRCQLDSNAQPEEGFESNENNRSRRILWDDEELHRQISILRILLEDRDFTFNVLNSPAEPDRDLILNRHRRYISSCRLLRSPGPSSSDEDELIVVD
ncbi:hypothetical protein AVEN_145119-2-1, partial [Araneus ventricosus]